MGRPVRDLSRQQFGRLIVVSLSTERRKRAACWDCTCVCGNAVTVRSDTLLNGLTKSCGCLLKESDTTAANVANLKHGHAVGGETPTHYTWAQMIQRCSNPNNASYKNYGARGIKVCDRWLGPDGFTHFLLDMGEKPSGLTIERINNDGNYEPSNCKWATYEEIVKRLPRLKLPEQDNPSSRNKTKL